MLIHYIKIAWRYLWKNRMFSAINILGLAIGISASLVIFLLVNYHFSFDKFEKDGNRIYRVVTHFTFSGESSYSSGVTSPLGGALQQEVTGLDAVVPFRTSEDAAKITVRGAGKNGPAVFKNQTDIVFADKNFFNLLNYQWLAGTPESSVAQPNQVVLTEASAKTYFPHFTVNECIGRELFFNDTVSVTVTGIVKNIKEHTDFTFKTFISRATLEKTSLKPEDWDQWNNTNGASQLLIKLSPNASAGAVKKLIDHLYKKYHTKAPDDNSTADFILQPLADIHFNADYGGYTLPIANKPTLYSLLAVAFFLLLLGCVNFINLATASASERAKEIGIRKTMGSSKRQLRLQFFGETFLLTASATAVSVLAAPALLKIFSDFIPEGLQSDFKNPAIIVFLLAITLFVSLLSGFYPAFVLSSFKPALVLKNQAFVNSSKTRKAWLRKTLTVFQFTVAQVFIIATILVSKQISYSLTKDMGFKKEGIITFRTNYYNTAQENRTRLLQKLKAIPEIAMISLATEPPSSNSTWSSTMKFSAREKQMETDVQVKLGDTNYIKLFRMKLVAGSNLPFSDTIHHLIINETYAHVLGFKDVRQAVGKYIEWDNKLDPVIGIVSDFHQKSLHEPIKPLVIASRTSAERNFNILLQPQNGTGNAWKNAITKLEKAFKEVYPDDDFDFRFFDESIARYYEAERKVSHLLRWATGMAIFISCLGLLGLVMFITSQRSKEIGVRKVVGASVIQIMSLLSKDFLKLIAIAFLIAVPVAWYGSNAWLQNFAYRTALSWWVFFAGGCIMLFAALMVLGIRTFKAATANPVKNLRTE